MSFMTRPALLIGLLASAAACAQQPSPLAGLANVTSVRVMASRFGADSTRTFTDPTTLRRFQTLATARGDWKATWHTPPAGELRAAFYHDSTYLGVVAIGADFVAARGASGERFRSIADAERSTIALLLAQK
jgi:hypothetical protein